MTDPMQHTDQSDGLADQRAGSGIVVLTAAMQLLHMNRQATELAKKINAAEQTGNAALAAALDERGIEAEDGILVLKREVAAADLPVSVESVDVRTQPLDFSDGTA